MEDEEEDGEGEEEEFRRPMILDPCFAVGWMDGRYVSKDGKSIIHTIFEELADRFARF